MFVLEDLWWGDLNPCERRCRRTPAFAEKAAQMSQREAAFCKKLSAEDREVYDQILSLNNESAAYEACDAFIRGFRTGAQTMLDVFGAYDSPLYESNIHK